MKVIDPYKLKRPKIEFQNIELGPHRQKVFVLPKESKEKAYSPFVWVIATFIVGFAVSATVIESAQKSIAFVTDSFIKKEVAVSPISENQNKLLGSDDAEDPVPLIINESNGDYYALNPKIKTPKTSALSFIVADIDTGQVILEKNSDMVLPMASVSKLMTAVIAKESLDPHKQITITKSSINTYGTSGGLSVGEKILVTDLLTPLLIESSNDAAEVLASGLGRTEFLKRMNKKTKELEMKDTFYEDPSGLSANNVSTVKDLLTLTQFISQEFPEVWDTTRVREYAILKHTWQNANRQLRKTSFVGGKNGFTDEALRTSVSIYDVPVKVKNKDGKERKRIAIIVLKSNDRDGDLDLLLRYVENGIGFEEKTEEDPFLGATSTPLKEMKSPENNDAR